MLCKRDRTPPHRENDNNVYGQWISATAECPRRFDAEGWGVWFRREVKEKHNHKNLSPSSSPSQPAQICNQIKPQAAMMLAVNDCAVMWVAQWGLSVEELCNIHCRVSTLARVSHYSSRELETCDNESDEWKAYTDAIKRLVVIVPIISHLDESWIVYVN